MGMPTSPVEGVEVFYGFMFPIVRLPLQEQSSIMHALKFETSSAGEDFLVTVVSHVAEYAKAKGYDGVLIANIECDWMAGGLAVKTEFFLHRLMPSTFEDVIDARSPHPVIGEDHLVSRRVILTDDDWVL